MPLALLRVEWWPDYVCEAFLVPLAAFDPETYADASARRSIEYLQKRLLFMEEWGIEDPEAVAAIQACIDQCVRDLRVGARREFGSNPRPGPIQP